jgi:hypothetical protein
MVAEAENPFGAAQKAIKRIRVKSSSVAKPIYNLDEWTIKACASCRVPKLTLVIRRAEFRGRRR